MHVTCTICKKLFPVHERDLAFYEKVSPTIAGKTYPFPPPSRCPECRLIRRLIWRNEVNLYRRKSDFTGKEIISIYSPDKPYKVYELSHYDKLDLMQWGMDIDPQQAIFPQLANFIKQVPQQALVNMGENEASEYCNYGYQCKNCYLCFWGDQGEDSLYNYGFWKLKDCIDNYWLFESELCYENVNVFTSFSSRYIENSENIMDSAFIANSRSLKNCMFCVNLQHKEYCLFNKQLTPEEFKIQYSRFKGGSYKEVESMRKKFEEFKNQFPIKNLDNVNVENVTGDVNKNSKNCFDCYHMVESEDCSYGVDHIKARDVYDSYGCVELEQCYDVLCTGIGSQKIYFSFDIYTSYNLFYCISCRNCKDCFGCVGLRHKQYCILNKQYTRDAYEALVSKIIDQMRRPRSPVLHTGSEGYTGSESHTGPEWGEFFPEQFSLFGYNESAAQEYFPRSKEEALTRNYPWSDYIAPKPEADRVIQAQDLPDHIQDVQDDILNAAIRCANTNRLFRLTKQELNFYRQHTIPLPRLHSDERRRLRMQLKNPRTLRETRCSKCSLKIATTVPSTNKRNIYCEKCYLEQF